MLENLNVIAYQLLKVEANTELFCDIRLERREKGWRIYDTRSGMELSSASKWMPERHKLRNLAHYRWDTAAAACEVWERFKHEPTFDMDLLADHLDSLRKRNAPSLEAYETAYRQLKESSCLGGGGGGDTR